MRFSSPALIPLLLASHYAALAQQVTQSTYVPPPTMEQMLLTDPTFGGGNMWILAANPAFFHATLEKQAASGKLLAQMMLGAAYIPPECIYLPFKTAPSDCPHDYPAPGPLAVTPSFELAIHWLSLASQQGNGEASEMLAEVIERMLKSPNSTHYQMTDVAHYHALARYQGFNLQDDEVNCYSLDPSGPADSLTMANTPAEYQFTPQELDSLHAAGASGTLRWGGGGAPGGTSLLRHPEGPKVHNKVILGSPASHELLASMGDRVDVTYLQQGDRIVTIPSTYPALQRVLSIRPPTADELAAALLQGVDGQFGGCATRTYPAQSKLP